MFRVLKRNNEEVSFDITKIQTAIRKAFEAVKRQYSDDVIELLLISNQKSRMERLLLKISKTALKSS